MKKITSVVLSLMLVLSILPGFAAAESKLWTEVDMPDGWTKVINEGGATLGYSKNSGLKLIEADGYAFKDLDRDGQLDVFEDWRVGYEERAQALVDSGLLSLEFQMGLKMNAMYLGSSNAKELPEMMATALALGYRYLRYSAGSVETVVGWNNLIQQQIEADTSKVIIPATFIADPLGGKGVSKWPGYLGVAASFDPEVAAQYGEQLSQEWRALGISMKVGPQIDLATEPRWGRADMTFSEDPLLSMDMSRAMINAWQSTYDDAGNDLGWGENSVNCQIKHVTGDGAGEGGRESHTVDGAFNVFPGNQFYTGLLPFIATLNLPGKTESASAAMTNMSIAVDGNGDPIGDGLEGTSYNSWKLNDLFRNTLGFDGYILPDFMVHNWNAFGAEDMTVVERLLALLESGVDAFGGLGGDLEKDMDLAMQAYNLGVEKNGQEVMDTIMNETTVRVLECLFNVGVVDNPYLSVDNAKAVVNSEEHTNAGYNAQVKSIVMLKNSDQLIKQATEEKMTVYIPWKYVPAGSRTPAAVKPGFDLQTAMKYFNVVTDKAALPSGSDGTYQPEDIIRATTEEIAACDFALVRIQSPQNGNPTIESYRENNQLPADYEYLPISLQYRPYTADSMYVRMDSIGGYITTKVVEGIYGLETVYEKENRSYYGKTGIITNETDLDYVLYAASVADKVVAAVDIQNSMVFSEFEGDVDAIVVAWGGDRAPLIDDAAFLDVISGKTEPSGLLPMQMPADMDTVEEQFEDVPRDMRCHVDANGNTYDFAFGMNWAGVIKDERVAKYAVDPISVDAISVQDYLKKN